MKLALNIGASSLNSDLDPADLTPDMFTNGVNFVIRNNKVKTFNGYSLLSTIPTNFFAGQLLFIGGASGLFYLVCGKTAVYVFDGGAWTNISSAAGYATLNTNDELTWTGCKLGNIPIINNPQHVPEYWSPQTTGQIMQPLKFDPVNTWIAKGFHAKTIRSHKNFLFAINLTESGVDLPYSYRWSHPADINGLPFTWDETDLSADAGKSSIAGSGGALIDGLSLRDSFCLYSESAINILDYVGGEFIFQARSLSSTHGLLAVGCVVEALGVHYFMSAGDIMANDGNSVRSILTQKVRDKFNSLISATNAKYSFAQLNQLNKEIWFFFPSIGSLLPDNVLIYNYDTGAIAFRSASNGVSDATFGPSLTAPDTWDSDAASWDSDSSPWGDTALSTLNNTINSVNNINSAIYNLEINTAGNALSTIIERNNLSIGGLDNIVTIQRVWPRIRSTGTVYIEIGSQNFLNDAVSWKPGQLFNANTQRKIDIRSTGKLHAWRISSVTDTPFDIEGFDIEYTMNGLR
jgi:hypothetical protein